MRLPSAAKSRLRRFRQTIRPPDPVRSQVSIVGERRTSATFMPFADVPSVLPEFLPKPSGPVGIVLDPRRDATPGERLTRIVQQAAGNRNGPEILDLTTGTLHGPARWVRITGQALTTLTFADVPEVLLDLGAIVVATAPTTSSAVVECWSTIVHPHSAMRARVAGRGAVADLALAVPAIYVIELAHVASNAVAVCRSPLAAELIALAAWRLAEQQRGIEAENPWEDERVQRLVESAIAVGLDPALSLHARVPDNRPEQWMTDLAMILGSELRSVEKSATRGSDE